MGGGLATVKANTKQANQEEKEEERKGKQVKKRKTKIDNFDSVERTEIKTMRKLILEEPKAPTQTPPSLSPQMEVEKKKEPQSPAPPPRKKQIGKKSKTHNLPHQTITLSSRTKSRQRSIK